MNIKSYFNLKFYDKGLKHEQQLESEIYYCYLKFPFKPDRSLSQFYHYSIWDFKIEHYENKIGQR